MANRYGKINANYTSPNGSLAIAQIASATKWAQSFVATESGLGTYISWKLNTKVGAPTGSVYFNVYSGSTFGSGTLLGTTESFLVNDLITSAEKHHVFLAGQAPTFVSGSSYWFEAVYTGPVDASNYFTTLYLGSGAYGSGSLAVWNGSAWVAPVGASPDCWFEIFTNVDGGVFDIDSDGACPMGRIMYSCLQTIKGSNPSWNDTIYLHNGKTLWIQDTETLQIRQIIEGTTSGGAALAGQRGGKAQFDGGCTISWGGSATAGASGILMNPTTSDSSSKDCDVWINGTASKPVIFTNRVGAWNANNVYSIVNSWGTVRGSYLSIRYTSGNIFNPCNNNADRTNATSCALDNCEVLQTGAATIVFLFTTNGTPSALIPVYHRKWYMENGAVGVGGNIGLNFGFFNVQNIYETTGFYYDYTGLSWRRCPTAPVGTFGNIVPISMGSSVLSNALQKYTSKATIGLLPSNVPTAIIPLDLTLTDLKNGDFKVQISNISSYLSSDRIFIYDKNDNPIGSFSRLMYETDGSLTDGIKRKPINCGIISCASLASLTGIYAKASSDNYNFSDKSATATVTPTLVPSADKILVGYGAGLNATEIVGTFDEVARNNGLTAGVLKKDEVATQQGVIITGTYTGSTALPPSAPVITQYSFFDTTASVKWEGGAGYNTFSVRVNGVIVQTGITINNYSLSNLTPLTEYEVSIIAVNDTGTSESTSILFTTLSDKIPLEQKIENGMAELIEQMRIADGYLFDWSPSNKIDYAKIESYPVAIDVSSETEDNSDTDGGSDSFSYSNILNVNITTIGAIPLESNEPKQDIKEVINKMIHDLKKVFGTYYYINSNTNVQYVYYQGFEKIDNQSGDAFIPVTLLTKWKIVYIQDRQNPLIVR